MDRARDATPASPTAGVSVLRRARRAGRDRARRFGTSVRTARRVEPTRPRWICARWTPMSWVSAEVVGAHAPLYD